MLAMGVWLVAAAAASGAEGLIEKVYVDEERGWAGRWPGKCEYSFQVREAPQSATVIFWGAGDFGKDSEGEVYLRGDNFREKIASWDKSKFNKTAIEAASYQDLNPISADVSRLVTRPGTYIVQFVYLRGKYQLDILRVEIRIKFAGSPPHSGHRDRRRDGDRGNRRIYESAEQGIAGALRDSGNIYTFANVAPCRRATLVFWAQASNSPGTCGDVLLQRPDGERVLVYRWRENDFPRGSTGELPSAAVDVSQHMGQGGTYKVLFLHRTGGGYLAIWRVQLLCEESGTAMGGGEFRIYNDEPVINGPRQPAMFSLETEAVVSYIETNHWNFGQGSPPGQIALRHGDGTLYGPWRATGLHGDGGRQNIAWMVMPNQRLKAGVYTVIDSDSATWACNARSNYAGFVIIIFSPINR